MSRLAQILAAEQPLFDISIKELEERTGNRGIDAKLAAEIATSTARHISKLDAGAEPSGAELYRALLDRVRADDLKLAHKIGGHLPESFSHMAPLIVAAVNKMDLLKGGWFIKVGVATDLLVSHPPTEVLKRLGYKSVEAMLSRENLFEVYGALRFAESPEWLNGFIKQYHGLTSDDFTSRDIKLVNFSHDKWGDIASKFIHKKLHNITHLKELGAILVLPPPDFTMPGVTLKIMPLILHYFNEIRLYSAYFKLIQSKPNFGEVVAKTLIADTPKIGIMKGQTVHWRVIQRYFGKLPKEHHPEIFQPHLEPEDLHYRKVEHTLFEFDSDLDFWHDLDFVAAICDGDAVSFNLMDVSLSYSNGINYKERYLYHLREALWNEIFARYFGEKTLEEQILRHLDNELVSPEKLPA